MADGSVVIDIGVSTQNAEKKIREIKDKVKSLASTEVNLKVNIGDAKSKLKSIESSLNNIIKMSKTAVALKMSTTDATSKIDGLIKSIKRLNTSLTNQVKVNINTNTATNQLKGLEESARNVSKVITKSDTFKIDTEAAKSKLKTVEDKVAEVNKKATEKPKVDIDTSNASNNVKKLNNDTTKFFEFFRGRGGVVKAVTGSLNNIESSFNKMTTNVNRGIKTLSNGLMNFKSKVELLTGSLGVISLAKKAVGTASSLQEVQNVVDVIFGDMSQTINDWSKTTKNSFGIAELEAKRYSSRLGALYKDFGFSGKSLTNLSTTMTELIADYASFFDKSFEDVYTNFESAISGASIRALREYGINLIEANLDTYSIEKGLSTVYSKMNDVDKAALRTAYILEKSADEAGDFARTFDSWANTLRTLKQTANEVLTTVGQALIQIFKPAVDYINILLNRLSVGAERFKNYIYYLFGISDTFKEVSDTEDYASQQADKLGNVSNDLTSSLTGVGDEAASSAKKMKQLLSPIDELNILADNTSDSLNDLGSSTTANSANALSNALNVDYKGIQFKKPEKTIKDIQDSINKAMSKVDLTKGLKILADKINLFFTGNNSSKLASNMADWINKGVSSVNTFLEAVNFENIGKYIANSIINFVSKVDTKEVGKMISNLFNSLVDLLYGFLNSNDFTVMGEKVADGINGIAENVNASKFGKTINLVLKRGAELALGLFKKIKWAEIGKTISNGINNAVDDKSTFVTIGKAFSELLNGAIDLLVNLIENTDWSAVGNAVAIALSNVDWGKALEGVGRLILDSIGAIFSTLSGMYEVDGIVGGIGSIATAILFINGASKAVGVVKGIVGALTTTGFVSLLSNPVLLAGGVGIAGLTMLGTSIAGLYNAHKTKNNTRSPIEFMTDEQKNLRIEVSKSNTEIDNLNERLKEYSDQLEYNYDDVDGLLEELKVYVDINGNIKEGYEDNVNYIKTKLKDAYGVELDIVNNQIQGYRNLEEEIQKVATRKKALALQEAFSYDMAEATKNQKQFTDNLISSEKEYEGQMDRLQDIADFLNENASSEFLNQFGKTKISADDLKKGLRNIDFTKVGWGLSNTQIKSINQKFSDLFGTSAFKNPSEWKAFGGLRQYTIEQSDLATELEFTKIQAESAVESNKKLIENYDNLSKVLSNSKSSAEDMDKAVQLLTSNMNTATTTTLDNLKYQAEELKRQYNDLVKSYKNGNKLITQDMIDEAEKRYEYSKQEIEKRAVLEDPNANSKLKYLIKNGASNWTGTFQKELHTYFVQTHEAATPEEYIEFYKNMYGSEHLNDALASLVEEGEIDPKYAMSAILRNSENVSIDDIQKLVDKIFPKDKYKDGVEDNIVTAFMDGQSGAIEEYLKSNPEMSNEDVIKFVDALLPDGVSDKLRDKYISMYTDAVRTANLAISKGYTVIGKDVYTESSNKEQLDLYRKGIISKPLELVGTISETGEFIAVGIAEGMENKKSVVDKAARELGTTAVDGVKDAAGVASPSKKTIETGKYIDEGLSIGIRNNLNIVRKAAQKLGDTVIEEVNKRKSFLTGLLNVFGSTLAKSLADGISAYKDKIYKIGKSIASTAVKGLCTISNLDKLNLVASGVLIVSLFKNGVSKSAKQLSDVGKNIPKEVINGITTSSTTYAATLKSKATSLINYFKSGITNGINSVKNESIKLATVVINGVMQNKTENTTKMNTYGVLLVSSFKNGISSSKAQVEKVATSIRKNLLNTFSTCFTDILNTVDLFYAKLSAKWDAISLMLKATGLGQMMGVSKNQLNITTFTYPYGNNNLPKLASGAVIKPNNEFMAVLGDQKRGVNIETPLETMVSAFKSALADSNASGDTYVPVYIGNEYLDTFIAKSNSKRLMRNNGRG